MKNLLSLLEKFSKILDKDKSIKETVSRVIREKTGAIIQEESVSIRNGVLELALSATVKNEVSLKEQVIKEELSKHQVFFSRILYK